MIDPAEILEVASQLGLRPAVVEKDYVLGWLLAGIAHNPILSDTWVFKGGTCLKKCYFETYRFSEDLDFTLTDGGHLNEDLLRAAFSDIVEWVYAQSGIEIPAERLRFAVYANTRGKLFCQGRVYYRGPIAPRGDPPRVKLDLTADELLVLEPQRRRVTHSYSDEPSDGIHALCYAFDELFAEKIRALAERARPRDLYDVINLSRHDEWSTAATAVRDVLREKCRFKGISTPTLADLEPHREELVSDWEAMLAHQLPELPPADAFWAELPPFLRWVEGEEEAPTPTAVPKATGELVGRGGLRALGLAPSATATLESIRFAASNRLCVDLDYAGSTRRIEPYSLRRTAGGALLLHALRAEAGQHRSYRVDRIVGVRITKQVFVPRYAVEFTPTSEIPVQPAARRVAVSTGTRRRHRTGPVYVYKCSVCGKTFYRSKPNPRNRAHKAPGGWTCRNRSSYLVRTRS